MVSVVYFLDILKYFIAGIAIFFVGWYFVRNELLNVYKVRLLELKKNSQSQILPLRLQAYERSIVLIDRINPANLLVRLHVSHASVYELQKMALSDIRAEYQHNVSQQLYISTEAWSVVKKLRDETINLINNAAKGLPADAPSVEMSKVILTHLAGLDENPYDRGIEAIKNEIQSLF